MGSRAPTEATSTASWVSRSLILAGVFAGLCADRSARADEVDAPSDDDGEKEPEPNAGCFSRSGAAFTVDNWDLFGAISANDVVEFARIRHPEAAAALEDAPEGSYVAERARDRIRGNKAYRREFSSAREMLRDAVFVAPDSKTFGLEHLGQGRFFLYVAGGSSDPFSDILLQGRMTVHDAFTMATMKHFRKRTDGEGPTWGIDLLGMPQSLKERIEENFDQGWKLRWRWKGLGVRRSSWTIDLDRNGTIRRVPASVFTLNTLSIDILDDTGAVLWTVN